ncbi:MAG TPA: hypothetical protein VKZ82_16515 [Nonomuraea sp.]|uniref:hypothetical protein n=1 Tax=Nonomuraea sp. NPDC049649 TaxID=3155776 RepID=UPI002C3736E6|nr:hypothetical protein [Nonomuraea sp.]
MAAAEERVESPAPTRQPGDAQDVPPAEPPQQAAAREPAVGLGGTGVPVRPVPM